MREINSEKIKEIINREGLSYEEFGKRIGLSGTSISKMVRGGGARPANIKKMAEVYKVDIGILTKREIQKEGKPADSIEMAEKRDAYIKGAEGESAKISDLLTRVVEILESSTIFRQALAANINAFHQAIRSEEKIQNLQGRVEYLESRLAAVEEKLKGG